jgi:Tat protein translocase TatC
VAGTVIGFLVVQNLDVLSLLKRPIAPFLPDGRLFITRPTDAFLITLKLAVMVGIVLAAPVVGWQIWAFLSPALYERERRFVVPAMAAGLVLFMTGVVIAYSWVLPQALRILFSFQRADLETIHHGGRLFLVRRPDRARVRGDVRAAARDRAAGGVPARAPHVLRPATGPSPWS